MKSGRRVDASTPFDHGADHVQRLRSRFGRFQDGKATQQVFDPIGRAWAVGLLENVSLDPAVLRDAGRDYAIRYWGYYPTVAGVANYAGDVRYGSAGWEGADPRGEQFQRLDVLLSGAGRHAYDAAQSLCLDFYWFPDEDPPWLARLINERMVRAQIPVAGHLPTRADYDRISQALDGLLALAAGARARSAA